MNNLFLATFVTFIYFILMIVIFIIITKEDDHE